MRREIPKGAEVAADELGKVIGALVRRLRAETPAHELSHSEHVVLKRLMELGPSTTAALARAELVKPQSMGVTLAALEEEGFVVRKTDPADARCRTVSVTEKGKRLVLEGRTARQTWLARAVAEKLDGDERRTLLEALALLRRVVAS
ncbi:MAG TPA: MarR family transcriptional regulator [Polyangiaceae bacterium]|jgi:DNA-binding MarR family transcriptional regulator